MRAMLYLTEDRAPLPGTKGKGLAAPGLLSEGCCGCTECLGGVARPGALLEADVLT